MSEPTGPLTSQVTVAPSCLIERLRHASTRRLQVVLVQQGAWKMPLESMPLASGYLKASCMADEHIAASTDIQIANFNGGASAASIASGVLSGDRHPDVVGFSVLGWNYRRFAEVARTFKSANPGGCVVFGGNHVARQHERVFRECPWVDVVVNGEGEPSMTRLLRWILEGGDIRDVPGIAIRESPRRTLVTDDAARIDDLSVVPSPILSGAIPLLDNHGRFRYDAALLETNRGCPYKCSFCYWGGAVGQRVREFPRDRLREELEYLAFHEVETVVLCDANFGMRAADLEFVEDLMTVKHTTGYPRSLETSWAKNKSEVFYEIVARMKASGLQSSFTLALQSLDGDALQGMRRKNMQINDWVEVADWLSESGLHAYAELIWGAPGETVDSFLTGYDALAKRASRIAVYPLLILPNTGYDATREEHGFITVRGEGDDYEYVLAHRTMSFEDNHKMQRFIYWARLLCENLYFRHIWSALRALCGISQSQALRDINQYMSDSADVAVAAFLEHDHVFTDSELIARQIRLLYESDPINAALRGWWVERVLAGAPHNVVDLLADIYEFDCVSRPVYRTAEESSLRESSHDGERLLVRDAVKFAFPLNETVLRDAEALRSIERRETWLDFVYRPGFRHFVDNHELAAHFVGRSIATARETVEHRL